MNSEQFEKLKYIFETGFSSLIDIASWGDDYRLEDNIDFSQIKPWHSLYLMDFNKVAEKVVGTSLDPQSIDERYEFEQINRDQNHPLWQKLRFIAEKIENDEEYELPDDWPKFEPHIPPFEYIYTFIKSYQCIMLHKTSMKTLFQSVINDNDPNNVSLFKILQIDKTAIYHDKIRTKITEALVCRDEIFIKKLTRNLKKQPTTKKYPELTFAVWNLLNNGRFTELTKEQRIELLQPFYPTVTEPESFTREIDRIKKSLQT